jgi:hypothetical protein
MKRLLALSTIGGGLLFVGGVQAESKAHASLRKLTVTVAVTVTGGPPSIGRTTRAATNVEVQVERRPIRFSHPQIAFTGSRGRATFHISPGLYKIEARMGGSRNFCEENAHEQISHSENLTLKCSLP